MCCMYTVYSGMQEWVIQIPSIPILVSVLFPSLHLKYFRIKFLLLVNIALHMGQSLEYGIHCPLEECRCGRDSKRQTVESEIAVAISM